MTQEDKELLLLDLCTRLPYGVMCDIGLDHPVQLQRIFVDRLDGILLDFYEDSNDYQVYLSECKPYLIPLSSMNEYQEKECQQIKHSYYYDDDSFVLFDWYNKNHLDYRGLIEKGLAIDATNLNIY
jgi:hypothetical protein